MRESVIYQDILEEGEARGEARGRQEGQEEKARQIALKMLSAGFSVQEIARFTDLSVENIEGLRNRDDN